MGSVLVSGKSTSATSFSNTYTRRAHHAGSWYEDDEAELDAILSSYLEEAKTNSQVTPDSSSSDSSSDLRALIVPHAGYRYSGPTAAHAYLALQQYNNIAEKIEHVIVLHPSHHVYLEGCAVSGAHEIQTPLGKLRVSQQLRDEILQLGTSKSNTSGGVKFTVMKQTEDEHEHSGEMQYPYLAKLLLRGMGTSSSSSSSSPPNHHRLRHDVTVLPIMVGALSTKLEKQYGELLSPILARENVLTVVSSDFCHWGSRFSFQPTPTASLLSQQQHQQGETNNNSTEKKLSIHEFIEQLDRRGMDLIELQQPGAFAEYLKETRNTICGRHAISVWLHAITATPDNTSTSSYSSATTSNHTNKMEVTFVKYAQSSAAQSMRDSSVSYAAAIATINNI